MVATPQWDGEGAADFTDTFDTSTGDGHDWGNNANKENFQDHTTDQKPKSNTGCRKRGDTSHFVKDCPENKCYNCNEVGHFSSNCPEPKK